MVGAAQGQASSACKTPSPGYTPCPWGALLWALAWEHRQSLGRWCASTCAAGVLKAGTWPPTGFALMGSHDALVDLMHRIAQLAMGLHKIVNDIRLLASGPRAGFGELRLPANEPGSSIMPGKVNPTQCEAVAMATVQVLGLASAVTMAGSGSHLQMNIYKPLLGFNLLQATTLLQDCCNSLRLHLVERLEVDDQRINTLRDRSLMLVTALAPEIGYDAAARVALHAHAHQLSLRDAALSLGVISAEHFDHVVDAHAMAHPHGG